MGEIEDPALVRFALILHDIGKGTGRDHSQAGVEAAHAVMDRLGAPETDRAAVEFLIQRHLDMSGVMSSRDLHDGATARALADRIGTIERLKLLTVLTFADISAVNPQAMTPWRLEQLWRVYLLAHQELTKELETERIHSPAGVPAEHAQFLEGLPVRYLRTHTPTEIDGHYALWRQLDPARWRLKSTTSAASTAYSAGQRSSGAVRFRRGSDRQLRVEYCESRGLRECAGCRGGHLHVLRSAPHSGLKSVRSGPPQRRGSQGS